MTLPPIDPPSDEELRLLGSVSAYPLVYIVWDVGDYGLIMQWSTKDKERAESLAKTINGIVTTNVIVHDSRKEKL